MTSYVIANTKWEFLWKKLNDFNILSVKKSKKNASIDLSYLDAKNCSSLDLSHLINLFFCLIFSTKIRVLCGLPVYLAKEKETAYYRRLSRISSVQTSAISFIH